ncbi:MAG: hypothetical protein JWM68_3371 [Verrucomicrobiales bacterium]|nr:hypothetical protein [Verrucomicrobiales bacterium]
MKRWLKICLGVLSVLLIAFVYLAIRAHRDLVTLDVRDMDVRKVVDKIEWQTWESIYVQKAVDGKVTLNVHDMPLDTVLGIIGEQTSSRWSAIYPLYSSRASLKLAKLALSGDETASKSWTNLHHRASFGGGMFGMTARDENQLVSLNFLNKELDVAAMAVSRFGQAHVVPENGASQTVSLLISNAPMTEAVALLANKADKSWTKLYELQGWRGGPGGREGSRDGAFSQSNTNSSTNGGDFGFGNRSPEDEEARRKRMEAQLATMTDEERKQFEDRQKRMEEMRNMSPEERRKKFGEMAQKPEFQARMQQRMMNNIQNLTPEQRVERVQRFQKFRGGGGR